MSKTVNVLIACQSGLTSTMIATRANRAMGERGLNLLVDSMPIRRAQAKLEGFDAVLLSPGIKHWESELASIDPTARIGIIPMRAYGRMDAPAVIDQALELMDEGRRAVAEGREPESAPAEPSPVPDAGPERGPGAQTAPSTSADSARKLVLCCGGGFSSSLLSERVQEEVERRSLDIEVEWRSLSQLENDPVEADCVLIAPQVSPSIDRVRENARDVPVALMGMREYGSMDAAAIVDRALVLIAERALSR